MKKAIKILFLICIPMVFSGCITIPFTVNSVVFKRFDKLNPDIEWVEEYPREEVWFYSGENRLQGFVYGKDNNKGLVVFSNGIHSYADNYGRIIRHLVDEGWRLFAFNGTGVADSEGSSMRGLTQAVIDLDAAVNYVKSTDDFNGLPIILMGFSMGGFAAPTVLNYEHNVNAVVSICGFNDVRSLYKYQISRYTGPLHYLIYPQTWWLQKMKFGTETASLTAVDGINRMQIPVLVMVDSKDDFLPPNKVGLYAYKDIITNPYIEYIYLEGDDASGHNFPRTHTFPMITEFMERILIRD